MKTKPKIAILQHFSTFQPGYALHVGWLERAKLLKYFDQDFDFLVNADCPPAIFPNQLNVLEQPPIGTTGMFDDKHRVINLEIFNTLVTHFENLYHDILQQYDIVMTGDILYQRRGMFLPQNQAYRNITSTLSDKRKYLNWVHSRWKTPNIHAEYPETLLYSNLDHPNSYMVYMNETELNGLAKTYHTKKVACVYNPKDFRSFNDFHSYSWKICKLLDVPNKDYIQTFPVCSTRLIPKGLTQVVETFAELKRQGAKVALIIANSNASNPDAQFKIEQLMPWYERRLNLKFGKDYIFTSEVFNKEAMPRQVIKDLFSVSNVFVFGSKAEVCPNTLLEAQISGNFVCINSALPIAGEFVDEGDAVFFLSDAFTPGVPDYSTYCEAKNLVDYEEVAKQIRVYAPDVSHKWKYSYERIWNTQLKPLIYE